MRDEKRDSVCCYCSYSSTTVVAIDREGQEMRRDFKWKGKKEGLRIYEIVNVQDAGRRRVLRSRRAPVSLQAGAAAMYKMLKFVSRRKGFWFAKTCTVGNDLKERYAEYYETRRGFLDARAARRAGTRSKTAPVYC